MYITTGLAAKIIYLELYAYIFDLLRFKLFFYKNFNFLIIMFIGMLL